MGRKRPIVRLEVPPLVTQLYRWGFAVLVSIVWDAFTILVFLGEDVFWKLNFVDTIYSNVGTSPSDVFTTVWVTGQMLIIAVFILWNAGILGYIRDWSEANL
jgi:hypothetical protein